MKKLIISSLSLLILILSCEKDDVTEEKELSISINNKTISDEGGNFSVEIVSNTDWFIEISGEWCNADKISGAGNSTILFTVESNENHFERDMEITFNGTDVNQSTLFLVQEQRDYILINSPTNSDLWQTPQIYRIRWEDNIVENVKIQLYKGIDFVLEIVESTESDSLYIWESDETLIEGNDYKIKISSISDEIIYDMSDSFSIINGDPNVVIDYDENIYNTVQIGDQRWMNENLVVTHYPDGTEIPYINDDTSWKNLLDNNADDAYCFYSDDPLNSYGALYTWAAAMGDNGISSDSNPSGVQGVCPDGWHLPSHSEWEELKEYLEGAYIAGGKMKEEGTIHWLDPNSGATNESGFTALPAGIRHSATGKFGYFGYRTYYWSSTNYYGNHVARSKDLSYKTATFGSYYHPTSMGFSVRCVKD